jgi:outer membrane protein OmpA-like peptidoglycan-associated protein
MKKVCFLIIFTLQFSLFGFAQSDADVRHQYTEQEITKISNYINDLEKKDAANGFIPDSGDKSQITAILTKPSRNYSDDEVIKLTDYIKKLETPSSLATTTIQQNGVTERKPSNDSLHAYSDQEINKFSTVVNDLEKRISVASPSELNPDEQKQIASLLTRTPSHEYTDAEVIKLANYIKRLTKVDSVNTVVMAKAKVQADSLAALAKVNDVHLQAIDQYEKLIFFNFNSSSLKEESYKPLNDVVDILKKYPDLSFVVEGYCDSTGSHVYNLALSSRRAESVTKYFVQKGIPASRVSSKGFGDANPIASNKTKEGRAKNRRVDIKAKKQ